MGQESQLARAARELVACKACGTAAHHLCDTPNKLGDIRTIRNYRCPRCGLVFVGNAFTDAQLTAAYAAVNFKQYYEEIAETEERKYATALTGLRRLRIDGASRLIDIGAGNGDFLRRLKGAGFQQLSGHEIPGCDTSALDRDGIPVYKDLDYRAVPANSFDVATLLDVLEHVRDPQGLARAVFAMLRPGGILYVHTPAVTATDRLMHGVQKVALVGVAGRIWQRGRTSIFHLQNFTPASLQRILGQAGFGEISIRRVNELSWPVRRYVRVYLCEKQGLPSFLSYLAAPLLYPFLATSLLNRNKAIVVARKPAGQNGVGN